MVEISNGGFSDVLVNKCIGTSVQPTLLICIKLTESFFHKAQNTVKLPYNDNNFYYKNVLQCRLKKSSVTIF